MMSRSVMCSQRQMIWPHSGSCLRSFSWMCCGCSMNLVWCGNFLMLILGRRLIFCLIRLVICCAMAGAAVRPGDSMPMRLIMLGVWVLSCMV